MRPTSLPVLPLSFRQPRLSGVLVLALGTLAGCEKSNPTPPPAPAEPVSYKHLTLK
ncbi:bifunctional metallophosphatase/5'-nucleotidase, partial [Pyxidicoccus fallax]|nr:bifunctional metallophosphatase/5'-nucleotidase [Pyxidicoccus fallax]